MTTIILVACDSDKRQTYTVTYKSDNSLYETQIYKEGDYVKLPQNPELEGFEFEYWFIDDKRFDISQSVTKNLELIAKFKEKKYDYTVSFYDGKKLYKSQKLKANAFAKSETITKENHSFKGWYTNTGLTEIYNFSTPITKNINLYAKWEKVIEQLDDLNAPYTPQNNDNYYGDIKTKIGNDLRSSLNSRLYQGSTIKTYSSSKWDTLQKADLVNETSNKVWLIYSSEQRSVNNNGGGSGQWNKEHVIAQKWMKDIGAVGNTGDQHNLRAADVDTNSDRGNKRFTEGSGTFINNSNSYYPGDEHKGDVARIIMYMMVMLPKLTINQIFEPSNGYDILLKWHKEDPVSTFELRRNDKIYEDQGNRNPFIDYPEFAESIWAKETTKASSIFNFYQSKLTQFNFIETTIILDSKKRFNL
ncbi:predicted endonuclease [Alteracholeplasma palmae J233]|uniref:Predicted endonuclease n=2 Tax=Acholeplasma palmae TaxID=38986 RepID=U4KJP5_ALTPJ|nr:predicted endonuclease [Alteracholeplasma palmae J233]